MPRRTTILGQRIWVQMHKNLAVEHPSVVGEHIDLLGLCDGDAQRIRIDPAQGPDKLRETYLHEHLHAMIGLVGMRDDLQDGVEEDIVKRLAPILLLFLRENPRVYTFLTGRPK